MGREKKPGFVFSLDAFVAFSLILISIQSLLVISSTPRGYYLGLNQADYLAQDTLKTLTVAQDPINPSHPALLDEVSDAVVAGNHFTPNSQLIVATDSLIPRPYSYAFLYYDTPNQKWVTLYNASTDSDSGNIHWGVPFHRVQASAQMLVMGYPSDNPLLPGESPYCNVVCKGWEPTNGNGQGGYTTPPSACNQVPCNVTPTNRFHPGDFNVGVLRLVVWG